MTTRTYALVVKTNQDISDIYHFIGGFITSHVAKKQVCEGDVSHNVEDVMAAYAIATKDKSPYHSWWRKNTCFKGADNDQPYEASTGFQAFYERNFPSIIFTGSESEIEVRDRIKAQFFKKFNVIVDRVDNSTLINEVKVRIDSDSFNEQYSRKYCYELLQDYEYQEKMFSGYAINKVEVASNTGIKRAITFYLDTEPTQEIVHDMLFRIRHFISNYEELMIKTDMANQCFYSETIEEILENRDTFEVVSVDLIEYVTEAKTKRVA